MANQSESTCSNAGVVYRARPNDNVNRAGVDLQPALKQFLKDIQLKACASVIVYRGTNHRQLSSPKKQSDHWSGYGADIDVRHPNKTNDDELGNRIAAAALTLLGQADAYSVAKKGGFHPNYLHKINGV